MGLAKIAGGGVLSSKDAERLSMMFLHYGIGAPVLAYKRAKKFADTGEAIGIDWGPSAALNWHCIHKR